MPGMKRPHSDSDAAASQPSQKRQRIVQHAIKYKQPGLPRELPLEDSAFFGSQLIRSISIACKAVGFDGVTPVALEAFRAQTEEYMLHFCSDVKASMSSSRRTQVIPPDIIHALSRRKLEPNDLIRQLDTGIPPAVTQPSLPPPLPADPQPPDLEAILGPELSGAAEKAKRNYIPKHFPNFPDTSTWKSTAAFVDRETDPQKLREKANDEGVEAEKALRELMTAAKKQKQNRQKTKRSLQRESIWEETLAAMLEEDERRKKDRDKPQKEEFSISFDFGGDSTPDLKEEVEKEQPKLRKTMEDFKIPGPVMVNYDSKYWRKSAQRSA